MINKISSKEIVEFNRVFSLLLISRIPVITALDLISRQTKNAKLKELIRKIVTDLKAGNSLSKGFSKYPDIFSEIYIANLKVAEETGNVAEILTEYTDYQEKFITLKKKIIQAARYPIFVLTISLGVIFFMLFFLMPTFETLFRSVKAKLPPLTAFLLSLSSYLVENALIVFSVSAILIFVISYLMKSQFMKINVIDKLVVKTPYIANLFIKNLLARFSLSMAVLLKNGVSLLDSLKISKNISTNSLFKDEITSLIKRIIKGESLVANVENSTFFDITFKRLLAAGEESAELGKVFYLISEYYSKEFDYRLENLTTLIEPLLILTVGLIVAVILIAMYLPMFEIINYVGA